MPDIRHITLYTGGILLLLGAIMPLLPALRPHSPIVFTVGALLFAAIQIIPGKVDTHAGLTVRRLRAQQKLGALLWIATGVMMFMSKYGIPPCDGSQWQLALTIGSIFQLYAALRLPSAIRREQDKRDGHPAE